MAYPNETYLSTRQAASYLSLSPSWLEKLRIHGTGPIFYKVSARRILYKRSDLEAWVEDHRRLSTSEPANAAKGGAA
jgi:excisionase family DNA binding protein